MHALPPYFKESGAKGELPDAASSDRGSGRFSRPASFAGGLEPVRGRCPNQRPEGPNRCGRSSLRRPSARKRRRIIVPRGRTRCRPSRRGLSNPNACERTPGTLRDVLFGDVSAAKSNLFSAPYAAGSCDSGTWARPAGENRRVRDSRAGPGTP